MLRSKLNRNPVWILVVTFVCSCSPLLVHGEDRGGPTSDSAVSPSSDRVSPPVVVPPAALVSNPALRDAKYYLHSTWQFRNVLEAGFIAGIPNLTTAPIEPEPPAVLNTATASAYESEMSQYSAGMDDWRRTNEDELRYRGRRFGFGLATAETRDLLSNLILPVALSQDPRYLPPGLDVGVGRRLGFAAESVVVTRDNAGRRVPNFSKLAGTAGAALIARYLYADRLGVPQLNSNQFMWRYIGFSLAGDAATNVTRELLRTALKPDLIRVDEEGRATEGNYYPLSTAGILVFWARSTFAPRNFVEGALIAGVPNIPSQPAYPAPPPTNSKAGEILYGEELMQYGTAMEVWRRSTDEEVRYRGKRFLAGFSESESQQFLGNCLIPLALRMDPRFIPTAANQNAGARIGNAFEQIAVSRTNSGRRMLNLPLLGGTVGAAFLAQHLYYNQLGLSELAKNRVVGKTIGFNLTGDLLLNLVHEFLPHQGI
jgi:hypothetical protein